MKVKYKLEYIGIDSEEIVDFEDNVTDDDINSDWWLWACQEVESYSSTFDLDDCPEEEYEETHKQAVEENSWWEKI